MAEVKKLHRSDDEAVAGVCAGIAEYFDLDPLAVRILAVLLFVTSFGTLLFLYVALWLVLPRHIEDPAPIDCAAYVAVVGAASVPSRDYPCECLEKRKRPRSMRGQAPLPPAGYAPAGAPAAAAEPLRPVVASRPREDECSCAPTGMAGWSRFCVWTGSVILAIDAAFIFSLVVDGIFWWQLWPLALTVAGLVFMFVPSKTGSRVRRFSLGLSAVSVSVVLVLMTTGLLAAESAFVALEELWPVLFVVAGLAIVRFSLQDEMFDLAIALCIVVVCAAMVAVFAVPGGLQYTSIHFPFGTRVYDVNPWL